MSNRPSAEQIGLVAAILIGTSFTALLTSYAALWERDALRTMARNLASERLDILDASLLGSTEVLYALRDLHSALGGLTEAQFRAFANDAMRRHPALQAIEWVPRVPLAQRARVEAERRTAGYPGFTFTEIGYDGGLMLAAPRPEYFPVLYIAPVEGNIAAHGMDLAHHPHRRDALERARDSGIPAATAPIRLAQEPERQSGFLLFLPVYASQSTDLATRRSALVGYALVVFRAGNLMQHTFRDLLARGIALRVSDRDAPGIPLFESPGQADQQTRNLKTWLLQQLHWRSERSFGGREWEFEFTPGPHFVALTAPWKTVSAFFAGLLLTLLLTGYVYMSGRRTREVRTANAALQLEVRERERAEQAARTANHVKSEFLASMSHEIRTPLNAVLGYAQWLRSDPDLKRDQVDSVNAIILSGNHLLAHINDVLDLSRIEAGRVELRRDVIELNALLHEIESMFRPRAEEKRLTLRIGRLPIACRVETDACKLRQILINLLGNAVRYTQVGEVFLGCQCARGENNGEILTRFDVIDTGPGIGADDLAHVFEPFYQGPQQGQPGGSGLGLAIAVRLSGLMKGELDAVSELGAGTRFTLRVPLKAVAPEAASPSPGGARGWRLIAPSASKVLIVDANATDRDVLQRLLASTGIDSDTAADLDQATTLLENTDYAALLVDPRLPDTDSARFVDWVRQQTTSQIVIACTTLAFDQDRERLLRTGCEAHLTKPLALDALTACLENTLGWRFEQRLPRDDEDSLPRLPDVQRVRVPSALLTRLLTAAELHSTTMLKSCIAPLQTLGTEEALLAAHLRHHMRAYDMNAITRLLLTIPHDPD